MHLLLYFLKDKEKFKALINIYDKEPKVFIRNIIENSLANEFNDLLRRGKMRFFNSTIFNVKVRGKKYAVFTTSNSKEKIMYIFSFIFVVFMKYTCMAIFYMSIARCIVFRFPFTVHIILSCKTPFLKKLL